MPYYECYATRSDAQKREYELKRKKSSKYLRWLIETQLPDVELL